MAHFVFAILLASFKESYGKGAAANQARTLQNVAPTFVGEMADKAFVDIPRIVDAIIVNLVGTGPHNADLDETTLAKASSSPSPSTEELQIPDSSDTFFIDNDEPGLIATFDFDNELKETFKKKYWWTSFAFNPMAWLTALCCVPCYENKNIEWRIRSQHVALTIDGIKFVKDKRKAGCGLVCQDIGRDSKTIPYDKITDCDVKEPAGTAFFCCIENVIAEVYVDTASSGGYRHELSLQGLRHPHAFKQAVWAMKRRHSGLSGSSQANAAISGVPRVNKGQESAQQIKLLTEIRDELRKINSQKIVSN